MRPGQRLGSIARRYQVSVAAIRRANRLGPRDPLRIGQKLLIPSPDDDPPPARSSSPRQRPAARPACLHRVESGQTLGGIARRYGISLPALCRSNHIRRRDKLRVGRWLVVPARAREQESKVSEVDSQKLDPCSADRAPKSRRARTVAQTRAQRSAHLELFTYSDSWRGRVLDRRGRLRRQAKRAVSRLLGADRAKHGLDSRLLRLLVEVSAEFGGRPIRVVRGYSRRSFFDDSRHEAGQAIDFSVPGVPNSRLRDYLRTKPGVGVGYYPNSSFVHLDVRDLPAHWVDYSGPGEPPRSQPRRGAVAAEDER